MILYQPVGPEELGLIYDSDFRSFPPRLPEQPIFYPVTNRGYAERIASEWNTMSNSFAGYVTEFSVDDKFVAKYDRNIVGASEHEELWVPAEELEDFNRHLTTRINVISAFFGPNFTGYVPASFGLRGKTALDQLEALSSMLSDAPFDFVIEISANAKAVYLNFRYWEGIDADVAGLEDDHREVLLGAIRQVWTEKNGEMPLLGGC